MKRQRPNVAGNRLARQGQSELTGVLGACNEGANHVEEQQTRPR